MGLFFIICALNIEWQGDWSGGSGTFSSSKWGNNFWQSESLTYNVESQVSPLNTGTINPTNWTYHKVDSSSGINSTNGIWPADFNNDGYVDLAGWKGSSNQIVFYKNDGSNNFSQVTTVTGPGSCTWGFLYGDDFSGDGLADLVVCSNTPGTSLYINNGNFNFSAVSLSTQCSFFPMGGDIDNDNDPDLVLTDGWSSPVEIYKNIGGTLTLNQTISETGFRSYFADLNNDGYNDLILGGPSSFPGAKVYLNNGSGWFTYSKTLSTNSGLDGLSVKDLDNDGDLDIICGAFGSQALNLWWFKNQGDGINYILDTIYISAGSSYEYGDGVFCEDLDMDGKLDIVSGAYYLAWFRQINPDNFVKYNLYVPASSIGMHWLCPIKTAGNKCFQRENIDILACWQSLFVWYENNINTTNNFANSWLESSVLKVKCDSSNICEWKYFGWKVCCPFYKAITFQIRSGKDSADVVGEMWSPAIKLDSTMSVDSADINSYISINAGEEFFQYRINFIGSTDDVGIVDSVWVSWVCSPSGVEEKVLPDEFVKVQRDKICYYLPSINKITLSLYDVTGRLVRILDKGEKKEGYYEVRIPANIRNGVYLVTFSTKGKRINKKLVIVR